MLEHFLVYFDRLHKRIFNHMALKQSLFFSPVETIIFWTLVFLLKMFTIEWHFVLFVDLTDFVFCTLYYTLRLCTDKKKNVCMTKEIQLCIFLHLIVYFVSGSKGFNQHD